MPDGMSQPVITVPQTHSDISKLTIKTKFIKFHIYIFVGSVYGNQ